MSLRVSSHQAPPLQQSQWLNWHPVQTSRQLDSCWLLWLQALAKALTQILQVKNTNKLSFASIDKATCKLLEYAENTTMGFNNYLPPMFPSAQNFFWETVSTLLSPSYDKWRVSTHTIHLEPRKKWQLTCFPSTESTGYPICLVHVDMTSATGLPLASPR